MRLGELLAGSGAELVAGSADASIASVTLDSRAVKPGMLFAAMPGTTVDGAKFIPAAVESGATAIICSATAVVPTLPAGVAVARAAEPRLAIAKIAANFYPRQPGTIVAVTGTNGKTSIAEFTRQIWHHLGLKAASLGTIGVVKGDGAVYGSLTTPDPITLHKTLQALADEGITHLALEASSHGLDQFRLDGVRLAAVGFNNLGRDHLDYHPTIEAYFKAKLRLFKDLAGPTTARVVNTDDPRWRDVASASKFNHWITVGTEHARFRYRTKAEGFQQWVDVSLPTHAGKTYRIRLPLLGAYQASNALMAAAFAVACGADTDRAMEAIGHLNGVKGRLEVVGRHNGGIAVVDYAHKPEALEACLAALRPFATGKLICVFGCGGNRDKGKRPIMGEISARNADITIVTDDNPRNEDPATVRAEILAGTRSVPAARVQEIGDRAAAIRAGVAMLGPGDVLLVAGKGHETGQIVGSVTLPFSDHEVIEAAIAEAKA